MDHIAKITAQLPEHGLDAMLVTSAPGERYAGRAIWPWRGRRSGAGG